MFFIITDWHKENPNDWVCIKGGSITNNLSESNYHILLDRDENLLTLRDRLGKNAGTYSRAWILGIGKDYPIGV